MFGVKWPNNRLMSDMLTTLLEEIRGHLLTWHAFNLDASRRFISFSPPYGGLTPGSSLKNETEDRVGPCVFLQLPSHFRLDTVERNLAQVR